MEQYILGIPKGKETVQLFTNAQDAGYSCINFVGVYAEDLGKAKVKFEELRQKDFEAEVPPAIWGSRRRSV
jgi:hypothetical protein